MSNVEEEVESQLSSAPPPKPKRKTLSTAERLRIIDDFRNGIPDRYYSVDLNPRKPGEYIVRKRKTPITYDIERPIERKRPVKPEPEPEADDAPTSKTPSQLLTEPKKAFIGTEFFSNKLDAKFRKERAARKAKNQEPNQQAPPTQAVRRRKPAPKPEPEPEPEQQGSDSHEYEYEYVDEPPAEQEEQQPHVNPFGLRTRRNINIRDF